MSSHKASASSSTDGWTPSPSQPHLPRSSSERTEQTTVFPFSPSGTAVNTPRLSFSSENVGGSKSRTRECSVTTLTKPSSSATSQLMHVAFSGSRSYDEEQTVDNTPLVPGPPILSERQQMEHVLDDKDDFIVKFQAKNDPLDPRNAPTWKKLILFCTIALNAFLVSAFASAYLFLVPELQILFSMNREVAITGFVLYVLGWGPGPLLWAPLSDSVGRKPVYIASSLLWTCFNIGCARAQNVETLLICRFLSGFFGCACLTNGGGSSVDIFEGLAVLRGTVTYSAIVFLGPVLGPIIGGAVAQYAPSTALGDDGGYRWLFYAAVAAGTLVTVLHCCCMETHHNTRLRRRVSILKEAHPEQPWSTAADVAGLTVVRKVLATTSAAMMMLIEEPIIILISIWQTTIMAIIYLFFGSFAVIFGIGHGFNAFQVGLCFLGVGVGMLFACIWGITGEPFFWIQRVRREQGVMKPELRIPLGLGGACLTVIGLFWFGYTSYASVHWMVPIVGSAIYGMGALSAMLATFSYIVDTYAQKAAPAFAAVGLIRSVVTSVLPLCGTQFYQNVGPRQATLILGCIALLEVGIPLLAMKYGEKVRLRSKMAKR